MKLNEDKCHLLVAEHKYKNIWAKTGEVKIWESKEQMLLAVQIDKKLCFDEYVSNFCKKNGRELPVLARLSIRV